MKHDDAFSVPDSPVSESISGLSFNDLVSDTVFNDLLHSIYAISGLRITLCDYQGERILAIHEYVTPFCRAATSMPALREICMRCTRCGGARAADIRAPFIYRCYAGLACAAIPVFAEDNWVATLVTSGFLIEPEFMAALEQMCPEEQHRAPAHAVSSAPFLSYQRAVDIANLLSVAARYIAEAGLRSRMQTELHQKTLELMEQQQIRTDTEKLLSQAEFKALQSQINPHFLFNTLNAISQLALIEGGTQTADAIFSLSALLRRNLKKNDSLPPLKDEVDNLAEYVTIKKLLYRDRIQYVCDVDPSCLSLRVPLFTLQPLAENALLHGLEPKEDGGTLTLSIQRENDFIVIVIADDGIGFDPTALMSHDPHEANPVRSDLTGIGINNVTQRLANHFGAAFHWTVASTPGVGTRITLYLPERKDD